MLFVESKDHGHLITRLNTYKIKFRTEPYALTLKFSTEDRERKYDLKLTSYDDINRDSIDKKVRPINPWL